MRRFQLRASFKHHVIRVFEEGGRFLIIQPKSISEEDQQFLHLLCLTGINKARKVMFSRHRATKPHHLLIYRTSAHPCQSKVESSYHKPSLFHRCSAKSIFLRSLFRLLCCPTDHCLQSVVHNPEFGKACRSHMLARFSKRTQ